jgi:hypothetical protein
MNEIKINDCHDCIDWYPGDSFGMGTVCGNSSDYPVVPEIRETAPIPDWCPRLAKQKEEVKK